MDDLLGEALDAPEDLAWRDVLSLMALIFVAVVVMLLAHVNPRGEDASEEVTSSGMLMVELEWDCCAPPNDQDVDLWIQAPGDVPVGYSNKTGSVFALLRDDLGNISDASKANREVAFGRGAPNGEYTINAHLFRKDPPVTVNLRVSGVRDDKSFDILETSATLTREGQELTLVRFELRDMKLVPGSMHHLQRDIRSGGGRGNPGT